MEKEIIYDAETAAPPKGNHLFPVFMKLEKLQVLVVGGGYVALEKLTAILQNAPETKVTVIGITIQDGIKEYRKNMSSHLSKERMSLAMRKISTLYSLL
ncbi:MAG: NAD(P)-dependent oxidoreductase [Flavitalea sp.]